MRTLGDMMLPPTLTELETFQRKLDEGFRAISLRAFRAILAHTIEAAYDYADKCWPSFTANPLGYCTSRNPREQGEALYAAALAHVRMAESTGRPIGCPGPRRCHERAVTCSHCGDVTRVCDAPEACARHRPFDKHRIRKAVLGQLEQQPHDTYRRRATVADIVKYVGERAALSVAPPTEEHLLLELDAMWKEGAIEPRVKVVVLGTLVPGDPPTRETLAAWTGEIQCPLPPQKPGEHAPACPVNREHWNEHAQCNPDLCAFIGPAWARDPKDVEPTDEDEDD